MNDAYLWETPVRYYFENWLNGTYCEASVLGSREVFWRGHKRELEFLARLEGEEKVEWLPSVAFSRTRTAGVIHDPERAKLG